MPASKTKPAAGELAPRIVRMVVIEYRKRIVTPEGATEMVDATPNATTLSCSQLKNP